MDGIRATPALRMHSDWAATAWLDLRPKISLANSSTTDHVHCFPASISAVARSTGATWAAVTGKRPQPAPVATKYGAPHGSGAALPPSANLLFILRTPGSFFATQGPHSLDFAGPTTYPCAQMGAVRSLVASEILGENQGAEDPAPPSRNSLISKNFVIRGKVLFARVLRLCRDGSFCRHGIHH
jgi:hypothetical protein